MPIQIHTKIPDNSSHPDKDLCSAAASFGLWSPTPFLSESSSYYRDLYFCGPLQSCYDSCRADECDLSLIRRYLNRALVMEVFQSTTSELLPHTVGAYKYEFIYPAWFCIRWVSIRWCCGWRWVVLCLIVAPWLVRLRGGNGAMRWPDGIELPKNCLKPPPGNKGGAGPVQGKRAT